MSCEMCGGARLIEYADVYRVPNPEDEPDMPWRGEVAWELSNVVRCGCTTLVKVIA